MIYTNKTISYYNQNAEEFVRNTINADMSAIREEFLMMIPRGGMILDLGCGSGRDSKSFIDSGYKVVMIDGSIELCKAAQELTKQEVICSTFQEYQPKEIFDGIRILSIIISGIPPTAFAITGFPKAIASKIANGNPSVEEG